MNGRKRCSNSDPPRLSFRQISLKTSIRHTVSEDNKANTFQMTRHTRRACTTFQQNLKGDCLVELSVNQPPGLKSHRATFFQNHCSKTKIRRIRKKAALPEYEVTVHASADLLASKKRLDSDQSNHKARGLLRQVCQWNSHLKKVIHKLAKLVAQTQKRTSIPSIILGLWPRLDSFNILRVLSSTLRASNMAQVLDFCLSEHRIRFTDVGLSRRRITRTMRRCAPCSASVLEKIRIPPIYVTTNLCR